MGHSFEPVEERMAKKETILEYWNQGCWVHQNYPGFVHAADRGEKADRHKQMFMSTIHFSISLSRLNSVKGDIMSKREKRISLPRLDH